MEWLRCAGLRLHWEKGDERCGGVEQWFIWEGVWSSQPACRDVAKHPGMEGEVVVGEADRL